MAPGLVVVRISIPWASRAATIYVDKHRFLSEIADLRQAVDSHRDVRIEAFAPGCGEPWFYGNVRPWWRG